MKRRIHSLKPFLTLKAGLALLTGFVPIFFGGIAWGAAAGPKIVGASGGVGGSYDRSPEHCPPNEKVAFFFRMVAPLDVGHLAAPFAFVRGSHPEPVEIELVEDVVTSVVLNSNDDQFLNIAKTEERIYCNPSLNELPLGTYNFIITEGGSLILGEVIDRWEVGVKHQSLAKRKKLVAAGQLSATPFSIEFNLKSPFRDLLVAANGGERQEFEDFLTRQTTYVLGLLQSEPTDQTMAPPQVVSPSLPPFEEPLPTLLSVLTHYCQDTYFLKLNQELCKQLSAMEVAEQSSKFQAPPKKTARKVF